MDGQQELPQEFTSQKLAEILKEKDLYFNLTSEISDYLKISQEKDSQAVTVQSSRFWPIFYPRLYFRNLSLAHEKRNTAINVIEELEKIKALFKEIQDISEQSTDLEAKKIMAIRDRLSEISKILTILDGALDLEQTLNTSYYIPWRRGSAGDFVAAFNICKQKAAELYAKCYNELERSVYDRLTIEADRKISSP